MNPRLRYLFTTLALVTVGVGYAWIQGQWDRPAPRVPARSAAVGRPIPPRPTPPTAREILDRGETLSLTADQKARLSGLDRKWREESGGLEAALQTAEEEFSGFMKEAQAGGRTSLQEIQRRSAEVGELSASLRERRLLHAKAAARGLTESQLRELASLLSPDPSGGNR